MTPNPEFQARLKQIAAAVEERLDQLLPPDADGRIAASMRYACLGGGKRLRAFMAVESAALFGGNSEQALRVAAAVEAVHAYSLIHDDLPAMDDDDLRRGKPTLHVKWDEATAILAGDALQALAFEILADSPTHPDAEVRASLCLGLARAVGPHGMVLGQDMDLAAEDTTEPLDLDAITQLQGLKTGALIEFSATSGAVLADADTAALSQYARLLGLAFQIHDDILDEIGETEAVGKRVGKDKQAGKATFVSLLGLEPAKARARELADGACDALSGYGEAAENLRQAAYFSISRSS